MNEIPAVIRWSVDDAGKVTAVVEWVYREVLENDFRPPMTITWAAELPNFRPPAP